MNIVLLLQYVRTHVMYENYNTNNNNNNFMTWNEC
jgi:hypothetical protein